MLSSIGLGLVSLVAATSLHLSDQKPPSPPAEDLGPRNAVVTLRCTVAESGRAENCEVIHDSHPGQDFAEAALAATADARFSGDTRRGSKARFSIHFDLDQAQAAVTDQPPASIFDLL